MASSKTSDSKEELERESLLKQLYSVASLDNTQAQRIVRSLPLFCKLLCTDIDLKGSQLKVYLDILGVTLGKILSLFIYSQDWTSVEALVILLHQNEMMSSELLSNCLLKPERAVVKELGTFGSVLNVAKLTDKLQWSVQHALETGSFLPLDLLLRLIGRDYEKRNSTFGEDANTLMHLSCIGDNTTSKFSLLPIWLMGWGIEQNTPNKEGQLPKDLLTNHLLKDIFVGLSQNNWIKDLAYMEFDAVKQFLLQQFCTSGQWLDMQALIERLKCLTGKDFASTVSALQMKRWNTACKALLDSLEFSAEGLLILKSALEESKPSVKRDVLLSIIQSVCWRLRYETVDVPFNQPGWLKELTGLTDFGQMDDYSVASNKKDIGVAELLKTSLWYKRHGPDKSNLPKSPKKTKKPTTRCPSPRIPSSREKNLHSFELEISKLVQMEENAAIFMPHSPSHIVIAADIIKQFSSQCPEDSSINTEISCTTEENAEEKEIIKSGRSCDKGKVHSSVEDLVVDKDSKEGRKTKDTGASFYKQQRRRRAKQRQRNNTVSEETPEVQPKLEYRKKHRRRTKSSSDSFAYLEDDFSLLDTNDLDTLEATDRTDTLKRAVLLVVPGGKAVASSVLYLRSFSSDLNIVEHAGLGKTKVGLKKLLRSSDVVVSHLSAVQNGLKSKSFAVKDASMIVFLDLRYSDDLFDMIQTKTEPATQFIMMFREFPYRSDVCSLESILQYVKAKLHLKSIITVSNSLTDVMRIMYPDVAYARDIISIVDSEKVFQLLKGNLSTTFGTYGVIEGFLFTLNLTSTAENFRDLLSEECMKLLPSSFHISLIDVSSSRKVKEHLFKLTTAPKPDQCKEIIECKRCNFCAIVSESGEEVQVEVLRAETLHQLCIDQLYCEQLIRVLSN